MKKLFSSGIEYRCSKIGDISHGVDGWDEYLLVTDLEDQSNLDKVEEDFLAGFYADTDTAGAYFCHGVTVAELPSGNEYIVIIHHRYNV